MKITNLYTIYNSYGEIKITDSFERKISRAFQIFKFSYPSVKKENGKRDMQLIITRSTNCMTELLVEWSAYQLTKRSCVSPNLMGNPKLSQYVSTMDKINRERKKKL